MYFVIRGSALPACYLACDPTCKLRAVPVYPCERGMKNTCHDCRNPRVPRGFDNPVIAIDRAKDVNDVKVGQFVVGPIKELCIYTDFTERLERFAHVDL